MSESNTASILLSPEGHQEWLTEKNRRENRYNSIGLWVALALYPVWSLLDYYLAPSEDVPLFIGLRFACAFSMLTVGLLYKRLSLTPEWMAYAVILTISTDIAYKCSVVPAEILTPYMIQYCTLFVCSGMLLLWDLRHSLNVSIYAIVTFITFNAITQQHSISSLMTNGGLFILTVLIVYVALVYMRMTLLKNEFTARHQMNIALKEVQAKNIIIEKKTRQMMDSINYGKRIQEAMLPHPREIQRSFDEHFILYKPKNVVSGDFYWHAEKDNKKLIAAADCTGHGVPGAFMSMIGFSVLNQVVHENNITTPSIILNTLSTTIRQALRQDEQTSTTNDGMDMAICSYDPITGRLEFAGARNSLLLINDNEMKAIKGDRQPIGGVQYNYRNSYTNHTFDVPRHATAYLYTDGFQDQFGGPENKRYGSKQFRELLFRISNMPLAEQVDYLHDELARWQGAEEQLDDILVVGVKFNATR